MHDKTPAVPKKRRTPLAPLAGRQHGCVSTAQLTRLGYNSAAIAQQVAAGRLHRKYRGVYAAGHPNLSHYGEWMAAVLAAGSGAALSTSRTRRADDMRDRLLTAAGFDVVRISDRALPPPSEPPRHEAEAL